MIGLTQFEALLERHLGLAVGSIGTRALSGAVTNRMTAIKLSAPAEYLTRLQSDSAELAALVEAIVVPETWFFRYPKSLEFLAQWSVGRPRSSAVALRILCLPCSTGEEPYSVAMSLVMAGLPTSAFRIEAVDVSSRAVAATTAGLYLPSAFREAQAPNIANYFEPHGRHQRVRPDLRAVVHPRLGNITDANVLPVRSKYDAIFCRNLFIYLTPPVRLQAIAVFKAHLATDGLLFVGHAESVSALDAEFAPAGPAGTFAFSRTNIPPRVPPARPRPSPGRVEAPTAPPMVAKSPPPAPSLEQARQAADAGRIAEALTHTEAVIAAHPTAEAYTLLGVLRQTRGETAAAEQAFTRALYLNPKHYDALIQLMLAAEARQDERAAANYRRRARQAGGP